VRHAETAIMSSSSSPSESSDPSESPSPSSSSSYSSWSSWFVSPSTLKARFQEFDDTQRIERLSECRKLDKILRDCRKRHQPGKPKSRYTKKANKEDPIESLSIGVRNMKYFGWRGILQSSSSASSQTTDQGASGDAAEADASATAANEPANHGSDLSVVHSKIRSSCAREEHAVWACRATATGCGKDLGELKKCFEEVGTTDDSAGLPPHVRVLTSPYTNYQGIVETVDNAAAMKRRIPCHEIQRRLGSCVTEHGKQLLERKQRREEQQQQQ
jgi:hypothetical protein